MSDGSEPRFEDVDTFCCQVRGWVTLALRIASRQGCWTGWFQVSRFPAVLLGAAPRDLFVTEGYLDRDRAKAKCSPKVFKYSKILEACQVRKEKRSAEQTWELLIFGRFI